MRIRYTTQVVSFIEFMGPSGVGKTSIINSISTELYNLGVVSPRKLLLGLLPRYSFQRIGNSITDFHNPNPWTPPNNLDRAFSNLSLENGTPHLLADYDLLLETHSKSLWDSDSLLQTKYSIHEFYSNLLLSHQLISLRFAKDNLISLFDESLLTNTRGISTHVLKCLSKNSTVIPKIIVFCECAPEEILKRNLHRAQKLNNFTHITPAQIKERRRIIAERQEHLRGLVNCLGFLGATIIPIDLTDLDNARIKLLSHLTRALTRLDSSR